VLDQRPRHAVGSIERAGDFERRQPAVIVPTDQSTDFFEVDQHRQVAVEAGQAADPFQLLVENEPDDLGRGAAAAPPVPASIGLGPSSLLDTFSGNYYRVHVRSVNSAPVRNSRQFAPAARWQHHR
jgi:hypothetical protein